MARTPNDVAQSLRASIASVDVSIDTRKGPIPDLFILPQSREIANAEAEVEDLKLRYSVDYVKTLNDDAISLFGANHGLRRAPGQAVTGRVYLITTSPPRSGQVYTADVGTLVATEDARLVYATTEPIRITSDNAGLYYNASRRRYEVPVSVRATGLGAEYAVPPERIRVLLSPLPNFTGVAQYTRMQGGLPADSNDTFMELCRRTLVGSALGSLAGLQAALLQFGQGAISSVSIVPSSDPVNFRRRTRRAACDAWVLGDDPREQTETQVAQAGQTVVIPQVQPVLTVVDVAVDGVTVPYTFVKDTGERTTGSVLASDRILLGVPPLALGQVITLRYQYDGVVQAAQAYVDPRTSTTQPATVPVVRNPRLYDCDILVRAATRVPVRTTVSLLILSSYDDTQAAASATAALLENLNPTQFVAQLLPERARLAVQNVAIGASSVDMLVFQRIDRSGLLVDALEFGPSEIPYADASTVTVRVRRT